MTIVGLAVLALAGCARPDGGPGGVPTSTPTRLLGLVHSANCRGLAPVPFEVPSRPTRGLETSAARGGIPMPSPGATRAETARVTPDPKAVDSVRDEARRRMMEQPDRAVEIGDLPPTAIPVACACAEEARRILVLFGSASPARDPADIRRSLEDIGLRDVRVAPGVDGPVFTGTTDAACVRGDVHRIRVTHKPC